MNKLTLPTVPDLPLGPQAGFTIHAEQLFFMDLDEAFYALTATNPDDWRNKSVYYLFDKLASPTHLRATLALFANAMEQLKRSKEAFFSFNLEFNMADEKLGSKRFLLQLGKLRTEGVSGMMACGGRLTDIHHMVNNGAPSLTIIKNNVVEKRIVAELQEEPTTKKIDLSARELEVLKLKSKGYDTREIAQTLNRSTLTIYSVVRDIKSKTRMEIIPLIKSLHEKGLLD